jgi:hypothetical protein
MQSPDTTLNLGQFQFARFEIPERIPFGGSQRIVVHEFVGGEREIDAMGRADRPLAWSGLIQGPDATERAQFLNTMRAQGLEQKLTFGKLAYNVIVREFLPEYERFYQIPYTISCEVIADLANPVTSLSPPSIDSDILTDYGSAQNLTSEIGDFSLSSLMTTVGTAISLVSSFANASRSTIAGVSSPLALVGARVGVLLASSNTVLGGAGSFGGVVPGASVGVSAASLVAQSGNMMKMNSLLQLGSVVARMSANLGAIASSPNRVTMAGGNLYSVAQQQYGDATAWTGIAKANNLTDPFVQGVQTLNIPPTVDQSDGVLDA